MAGVPGQVSDSCGWHSFQWRLREPGCFTLWLWHLVAARWPWCHPPDMWKEESGAPMWASSTCHRAPWMCYHSQTSVTWLVVRETGRAGGAPSKHCQILHFWLKAKAHKIILTPTTCNVLWYFSVLFCFIPFSLFLKMPASPTNMFY